MLHVLPHRDFDQLRVAFQQNDIDHDGYIPRAIGLRLLLSRCQLNEAVVPALNIVDLGRSDTCDLAAIATADLIAREFFAAGPTNAPLVGPFGATDLAPRLLKRFFEIFAEKRNGVPSAAVQLHAIRAKLRTATAKDVEAYAKINYDELLSCLPEDLIFQDTGIDSNVLTAQLSASAGRGTPLGTDQELSPLRADSPWELPAFLDLFGIFYTCSSSKRDDSPGSIRMLKEPTMTGMRGMICAVVALLVLVEAAFDDDQEIQVSMNKVWPYSNPTETYEYYDFPFCKPKTVMPHFMTLGQVLRGDRLVNSLYPMHMKRQVPRTVICQRPMSEMDILKFKSAIDQNYMFELFVGELPIASSLPDDRHPSLDLVLASQKLSVFRHCMEHIVLMCFKHVAPSCWA
eukprot:g13982.t1